MERIEKWACISVSLMVCGMFGVAWMACEVQSKITRLVEGMK